MHNLEVPAAPSGTSHHHDGTFSLQATQLGPLFAAPLVGARTPVLHGESPHACVIILVCNPVVATRRNPVVARSP